ncbi:TetR/AcrR family transcriptional regulator [Streptomyces sp. NPDC014734]|uniref:TetR/AcrR family transcriptional regulator n=1 Tax=Streptomyces sp. NPDC014734 TaxID=3364886 RepID=UPI0036FD85EA
MAALSRTSPVSVSASSPASASSSVSSSSSVPGVPPQLGLRERKKLRTRITIRRATYRLIAEQGYDATTIEQIAEAAEVSPSTVFRYFASKEDIVLTDEYGAVLEAELRERPAGEPPLASLRSVLTGALSAFLTGEEEELRQRTRLTVEVPAVRARMTQTLCDTAKLLADVLAERSGRDRDDLEVRVFVAAVLAALREVALHWGEHGGDGDLVAMVDQALDTLEGGLTLRGPS